MVKRQRGKASSLKKRAEAEKPIESLNMELESSDDEAPEEVTFEESKAEALRSMKQTLDTARRERELLKEKRRKKQELFQEQKKRKLLPAEVLEEIDSTPSEKQKQSKDGADEEEGEEAEDGKRKRKKKSVKMQHVKNVKGNYTVTLVTEREAASFQQKVAEDFIQSRLYGPGSRRSTNNELLSIQNKNGEIKCPAVQFVKKDGARKHKAKAERVKKCIHKQHIPSS